MARRISRWRSTILWCFLGAAILIFTRSEYNNNMPRSNRLHFWVILTLLGFILGIGLPGPAAGGESVTVWAGAPNEKAVALTFDDGPSPVYTPQVMALLKKYQARGTFFVMGHRVEQYPGLVQALVKAGHEVGNHSFSHPRLTKTGQLSREQELERTAVDLDLLGCPRSQRLFRPPYSAYDDRLKAYLANTRRCLVLWSLDSGDWRGLAAPAIIENVLSRVRNGAIIIFHDSDENAQADRHPTVEALRTILPTLKAAGYRMVTVSELLKGRSPQCRPRRIEN
jgi:peptidoglycan/xylan/chitin deacetylase (PgdA/CDA1 family)